MADVTVLYKGSTIATMDGSGTKVLKTGGTYCEGDVTVAYTKPVNAGTAAAEDIAFGETAWVNGVKVTGSMRRRVYKGTIPSEIKGGTAYAVLAKDSFFAEHRNDSSLFVEVAFDLEPTPYSVVRTWAINDETDFPMGTSTLHQWILRYGSDGSRSANTNANPINGNTSTIGVGVVNITAEGELRVYSGSSNYAIRPSNYTVVVEW